MVVVAVVLVVVVVVVAVVVVVVVIVVQCLEKKMALNDLFAIGDNKEYYYYGLKWFRIFPQSAGNTISRGV